MDWHAYKTLIVFIVSLLSHVPLDDNTVKYTSSSVVISFVFVKSLAGTVNVKVLVPVPCGTST